MFNNGNSGNVITAKDDTVLDTVVIYYLPDWVEICERHPCGESISMLCTPEHKIYFLGYIYLIRSRNQGSLYYKYDNIKTV